MNKPRYIAAPAIFPAPGMLNGACTRYSGRSLNTQAYAGSNVIPVTTVTKCATENIAVFLLLLHQLSNAGIGIGLYVAGQRRK